MQWSSCPFEGRGRSTEWHTDDTDIPALMITPVETYLVEEATGATSRMTASTNMAQDIAPLLQRERRAITCRGDRLESWGEIIAAFSMNRPRGGGR